MRRGSNNDNFINICLKQLCMCCSFTIIIAETVKRMKYFSRILWEKFIRLIERIFHRLCKIPERKMSIFQITKQFSQFNQDAIKLLGFSTCIKFFHCISPTAKIRINFKPVLNKLIPKKLLSCLFPINI